MLFKKYILFVVSYLLALTNVIAQSVIEADLLSLSEMTLNKSPLIKRNGLQIDQAEANYRSQRSAFDYNLTSGYNISKNKLTPFDADPRNQLLTGRLETNRSDFSVGLQKRFRTGLIAEARSNYNSASDNLPINNFGVDVGPNLSDDAASATIALTQPILRGNGLKVTTAFERSAALDIESAKQNFELNIAFELSQLGKSYWQYVAGYESLKIFQSNENRVRRVLEITRELVKADKKPESDLIQIQADLADKERQTTVAEQSLFAARMNLGRVIGISEEESQLIGNPVNNFPTIMESKFTQENQESFFVSLAKENRKDITAIDFTLEGLDLQLSAAKNSTLPQLDITGFVTYGGASVGGGIDQYFNAFSNNQGRSAVTGLGLTFSFPLNNNLAKANMAKNKIAIDDQNIAYTNLIRNVELNISIANNNLRNSVLILEKAEKTLKYYQQVFDNEQTKFQNGLTTLLNLILFQERLTFSQLDYMQAQQQFASAIVDLRFETGTLLKTELNAITQEDLKETFYTLPINN
jgi:outer membrane protein